MKNPTPNTEYDQQRREVINELTNAYFETYRYDRPNDTVEQLGAFCRDIATNEVDELIAAAEHRGLARALELVGPDEPLQDSFFLNGRNEIRKNYHNQLRAEIRQRITKEMEQPK